MTNPTSRVRITDVAQTAGVSLSTVSRVMNGNPTVDPDLAERVRAVAADLGYSANPLARSLVLGRTQTIAVVIPDLANPTFQAILHGLSRAAAEDGYHVLIADSAEQVGEEIDLVSATRRRTDGVVLCAPRMPAEQLATLLASVAPAVVVNRPVQDAAPTVSADYGSAMAELVEHVHGLGHRHLAYLSGVPGSASGAARRATLDAACATHPDLQITEISTGVGFDSGARVADEVIAAGATAALAFNDLVAMGLLSALAARGIRVPDDISVTGFDDIPFAAYTTPPLTTATVPSAQLGRDAWTAMRALLEGASAPESTLLTPEITVRESTGPAPANR